MAIILNDNLKISAPKPSEERFLHPSGRRYVNAAEVNSTIESSRRFIDCIVSTDEGFFIYDGGTEDTDLIPYNVTNPSGLTYSTSTIEINGDARLRLNGSDSSFSDVKLIAGDNMSVEALSGDTITFSAESGQLISDGDGYVIKNIDQSNFGQVGFGSVNLTLYDPSLTSSTINTYGVTGVASFATGINHSIEGATSFAAGATNRVLGDFSAAFGFLNSVSGDTSIVFGARNSSNNKFSSSFGARNLSTGAGSSTIGVRCTGRAAGEIVVGANSLDVTAQNPNEVSINDLSFHVGTSADQNNRNSQLFVFRSGLIKFRPINVKNAPFNVNIPNGVEGAFGLDNQNNNRPTIHNGTEWKELAYVDELGGGASGSTGELIKINEGNGDGYALKDRSSGNYGIIGFNAKDFSFSDTSSTTLGSTGENSFTEGLNTTASGPNSHAEGRDTQATSNNSHTEGSNTLASGPNSHAEGDGSVASGVNSHAEGDGSVASGLYSHAEGNDTEASEVASHAEGSYTEASGVISHAEGLGTEASGSQSHAEGDGTIASGVSSHAEGNDTEASGVYSHAEGNDTIALGTYSHAEGNDTIASGRGSHAEGFDTEASNQNSHAEGRETIASGAFSHAQGDNNFARGLGEHSGGIYGTDYTANGNLTDRLVNYGNGIGPSSRDDAFTIYRNGAVRFYRTTTSDITNTNKEGLLIYDSDDNNRPTIHNGTEWKGLAYVDDLNVAEGNGQLVAIDEGNGIGYVLKDRVAGNYGSIGENAKDFSFSNNSSTTKGATGAFSFAEGFNTVASGPYSHAQGFKTIASGEYSHAKGFDTEASEVTSHAEGSYTRARGSGSHAEGFNTTASGTYSHAEGFDTEASNQNSHAEGRETIASGAFSHAQGYYNYARGVGEFSGGAYGTDYTPDNTEHPTDRLVNYGNGISTSSRDDAFTIYRNGAVRFYRNELSAITNADAGFLIYDSDDNNRPTIHNGTEWKGLAYVDELGSGNTDTKINALGFNSADGVLTATRDDLITVTTNLDGRYSLLNHTHTISDITNFPVDISYFNNDAGYITSFTDTKINALDFNSADGVLTATRDDSITVTTSLDGRYSLLNHTHTISDITNFPVDISYFNNDAGYITSFTNSYLDSAGFSTSTGVLSLSRNDGLSDVTVDLDGRYSLSNHTHTISDITNFPVDISYFNNDAGYITSFTDTYVNDVLFDTSNGVLTLDIIGGANQTADLDGRYVDLSNTQTIGGEKTFTSNSIFNGDVGIGTDTPSAKLDVNGNIIADKVYSTSATSSLRKLKKNLSPFNNSALALVDSLDIYTFDYKEENKGVDQIGIMADDSPDEFLTEERDAVNLYKTLFVQAKAIQELSQKNKYLENKLSKLDELEKRLKLIEDI